MKIEKDDFYRQKVRLLGMLAKVSENKRKEDEKFLAKLLGLEKKKVVNL